MSSESARKSRDRARASRLSGRRAALRPLPAAAGPALAGAVTLVLLSSSTVAVGIMMTQNNDSEA